MVLHGRKCSLLIKRIVNWVATRLRSSTQFGHSLAYLNHVLTEFIKNYIYIYEATVW